MDSKQRLRTELRRELAVMPEEAAAALSGVVCERIVSLPEFDHADTVMVYCPIRGEVDVANVAAHARGEGKRVVAPRVADATMKRMVAVACEVLDESLPVGAYGIREPDGEEVPPERIDLVLVPALAFDLHGNRLGRGGGYYDRFLAAPTMRATLCGTAFDAQVRDLVPTGEFDQPVHMLATDKRLLRFDADNGRSP